MIICSIIVIPTINFIFIALSPTDFWDVHYENKEEKKKKETNTPDYQKFCHHR